MTWVAMTIPDDPAALLAWLEARLVGPDLGRLVAELRAANGDAPPPGSVDAVLGGHAGAVLASGLSVLPQAALRTLLRHPALLLELQERVLVDGGGYWSALPATEEFGQAVDRGWERLRGAAAAASPRPVEPAVVPRRPGLGRRLLPYGLTSLATAAAVLIAVYLTRPADPDQRPVETAAAGWGWQRPGAFPGAAGRAEYLNRLADGAEEWFRKRPDTPESLARRIGEFRQGCAALQLAEHGPLPEADRAWLRERCRAWSKKLDEQLARLEETRDVAGTAAVTDATVRQLVTALRTRAGAA